MLIVAAPQIAAAEGLSAFDALHEIARTKGAKLSANAILLQGADAAPQPTQWTATFKDDEARDGIREFVVNEKGIAGERTPLLVGNSLASGVMTSALLKIDSTDIFTKANAAAAQAKMGFNTLNYLLSNVGGSPVWTVRLIDVEGNEVGMIAFSAKDGSIVTPLKATPPNAPAPAPATPDNAKTSSETNTSADDQRPLGQRWVEGGGLFGHMDRWGQRTWKATGETADRTWKATGETASRVGDSISAFFTGRPAKETNP